MADPKVITRGYWYKREKSFETMQHGGDDVGPLVITWLLEILDEIKPSDSSGIFPIISQVWQPTFVSFCNATVWLKAGGVGTRWVDDTIVNPSNVSADVNEKLRYSSWLPMGFWNGKLFSKPDYLFGVRIGNEEPTPSAPVWGYETIKSEHYWIEDLVTKNKPQDISGVKGFISQNKPGADYDIHVFCRPDHSASANWKMVPSNYTGSNEEHTKIEQDLDSGRWRGLALVQGHQTHVLIGVSH